MSDSPAQVWKFGGRVNLSREMAVAYGIVEPTVEERAEGERLAAEYRVKATERRANRADAMRRLLTHPNDAVAKVAELHAPVGEWPECHGCPGDEDYASWPCPTIELVASIAGVSLEEV